MLLHVATLAVSVVFGQLSRMPDVDPFTVESPSKTWRARFTPSDRDGKGPSTLVIEHDGASVAATFEFAFDFGAITDEGFVVGCGHTGPIISPPGEFIVFVIRPDGSMALDERTPRVSSPWLHAFPNPDPIGLLVDPLGCWFVVRVVDPDRTDVQTWWRYSILTAVPREKIVPELAMGLWFDGRINDARVIPDTEWFVVNWSCSDRDAGEKGESGVFTVIDQHGAVLWRLDLKNDYEWLFSPQTNTTTDWLGPILGIGPGPRFELWHVNRRKRVRYRVDVTAAADARVIEESQKTFGSGAIEKYVESRRPKQRELPTRRLEQIAEIPLVSDEPKPALGRITDFDFDAAGNPIVIRSDPWGDFTSLLFDANGGVQREVAWETLPDGLAEGAVKLCSLGAGRWLVSARTKTSSEHGWFIVDAHDGKLVRLGGIGEQLSDGDEGRGLDAIAARGTSDGGFVALTSRSDQRIRDKCLVRCDRAGQVLWEIAEGDERSPLHEPDAATVLADGVIAVVESWPRYDVRLFDDSGHPLATIDLIESFGAKPDYMSAIHWEPDGGFLIEDLHGAKSWWQLTREGKVTASFTPRLASGHEPRVLARNVRPAPDGASWTHDSDALYVLDASGGVARTIGPELDADALSRPYRVAIDGLGRTWIHDQRSDALHGFDADGKELWIAKVAPGDGELAGGPSDITARPDGGILVAREGKSFLDKTPAVRFGANGLRLGRTPDVALETVLELKNERFVASAYRQSLSILDAGGVVLATHKTMPNGHWAELPDAVTWTADGHAALIVSDAVVFLDDDGKPDRSIPLPQPMKFGSDLPWIGSQLAWSGDHVLVGKWPSAMLYSFTSNEWEIVTIADEDPKLWGVLGLSADGENVLAINQQDHVLRKFALK